MNARLDALSLVDTEATVKKKNSPQSSENQFYGPGKKFLLKDDLNNKWIRVAIVSTTPTDIKVKDEEGHIHIVNNPMKLQPRTEPKLKAKRTSEVFGTSFELVGAKPDHDEIAKDYIADSIAEHPHMKKEKHEMIKIFKDSISITAVDKVDALRQQVKNHEGQIQNKAPQMKVAKEGADIQVSVLGKHIGKTFHYLLYMYYYF